MKIKVKLHPAFSILIKNMKMHLEFKIKFIIVLLIIKKEKKICSIVSYRKKNYIMIQFSNKEHKMKKSLAIESNLWKKNSKNSNLIKLYSMINKKK